MEQVREAERTKKKPFLFKRMTQKKKASSLSRQFRESKPNAKLISLCLEFNKSKTMFATLIYLKIQLFSVSK